MSRKTFTVFHANGRRSLWISDSQSELFSHMDDLGKSAQRILPGNFVALNTGLDTCSFSVDETAFRRACHSLRNPVRICYHSRMGTVKGSHRFINDAIGGPFHSILLKSYLDPIEANITLWHELRHAQQAEKSGSVFTWNRLYVESQRTYGYQSDPYEIDAERYALKRQNKILVLKK
jgi:hypothetical protein